MGQDEALKFLRSARTLTLPADAEAATAAVLGFVRGDADHLPRAEIDALRRRVERLRDPLSRDSLDELIRQLPVLEALWLHFAASAANATSPDSKAKLLRMALQSQQAFARSFTLVRGLALQHQGKAAVSLIDGRDDDTDEAR